MPNAADLGKNIAGRIITLRNSIQPECCSQWRYPAFQQSAALTQQQYYRNWLPSIFFKWHVSKVQARNSYSNLRQNACHAEADRARQWKTAKGTSFCRLALPNNLQPRGTFKLSKFNIILAVLLIILRTFLFSLLILAWHEICVSVIFPADGRSKRFH